MSDALSNEDVAARVRAIHDEFHGRAGDMAVEIERLRDSLRQIKAATDADNPESYRADDREGCLDYVQAAASDALTALEHVDGR